VVFVACYADVGCGVAGGLWPFGREVTVATVAGVEVVREVPVVTRATGDPQMLGLPSFVVGSIALGLQLVGYVDAAVSGAPLGIILAATGLGLLVSTVWAAYLGQTFVAGVFGIFAGFWLSYSALILGLQHNWFLIPPEAITDTVVAFLISWAIIIFLLTIVSVRLPSSYTITFGLIVVALVILIFANENASTGLTKLGGWLVFAFAAVGAYIWLSIADISLGGRGYPLGRPLRP
jgi:succinate-acetate transporter protein